MDGAAAHYERRRSRLARLVEEGRRILQDLPDGPQRQQQAEQLEDLRLQLNQAEATLARLNSQRTVLMARLRAAERSGAAKSRPPRVRMRRLAVATTLGVVLLGAVLIWWKLSLDPRRRFEIVSLPREPRPGAARVTSVSPRLAPPAAIAPFDAPQAREYQEQWAKYLGVPVEMTNSIGMKLVLVPPGEFDMGSTSEEINRLLREIAAKKQDRWYSELTQGEAPRHRVRISRPFYMGVYEVTQAEYERALGHNPSEFSPKGKAAAAVKGQETGRLPVESLCWEDAADFCRRLSDLPEEKSKGRVYRLPTEGEWEYAYKAGAAGPNVWDEASLGEEAWFQSNSLGKPHPVGLKRPNAWGLYDMLGNVFEWCGDWVSVDYYSKSPFADPAGPSSGQYRAARGGSFGLPAISCRYTYRYRNPPTACSLWNGLRIVLSEWGSLHSAKNLPATEPTAPAVASPPLAVAPFDAAKARKHQEQWAEHLGVPLQFANSVGMNLVLIPPGAFQMGSRPEEVNCVLEQIAAKKLDVWFSSLMQGESPQHSVRISKPFYFGVYEVTQAEYERVMGRNPSDFSAKGKYAAVVKGLDTARLPADSLSWSDAADFCRRLSDLPEEKSKGRVYRLPTEAAWEYASKAGATGPNVWDDASLAEVAWFQSNSGGKSHPVGLKPPNAWGLHDTLGNVFEWCSDWIADDYYGKSPLADPTGPSSGTYRAHRGGYFGHPAISCRHAYRHKGSPEQPTCANGMRVVLSGWSTPPSSEKAKPAVALPAKP